MPISSQNNLGEITNANYKGVTSCYQCLIGGNKCQGVESGADFGPYMILKHHLEEPDALIKDIFRIVKT